MTFIKMISEQEASDVVQQIYNEVKSRYNINFVPNLFMTWARNPQSLKANWERMKHHEDVLGMELAHAVGFSTAIQSPCTYCTYFHGMILRQMGWSEQKIEQLISWAAENVGGNIYANGLQIPIDNQASQIMQEAA